MLSRWKKTFNQVYAVIAIFVSSVQTVEVRLNFGKLGQSENQGRVEVRKDSKQSWGQVCDLHFGELEAAVVCKQLHYKYARYEKDVYIAKLPDFVLENVHCKGNENELGECINGEWKVNTGECSSDKHNYASVCCSNSPNFGVVHDGVFVSDCADFWLDAEQTCEEKNSILASVDLYTSILGSHDVSDREKGFWTQMFFTPWLWSNGCFKISNTSSVSREFTVQNNSAQVCLQLCSIERPTSFLLSGNVCRCLSDSLKSSIIEVLPGFCNKKCVGNMDLYCGNDNHGYWNYFSIASEEQIFFRISDPLYNQERQCAVILRTRKLVTENCYNRRGYICGQVENNGSFNLMPFKDNKFFEVNMKEAQQRCKTSDTTTHLVGEKVFSPNVYFSKHDNLWVDVIRTLTAIYQVDIDTDSERASGRLRNLDPKWCLSRKLHNKYYRNEISLCQQERLRYICSPDSDFAGTTVDSGSSDETTSGSTVFNHSYRVTSKHDHTNINQPIQRLDIHSIITIVVSVLCAVVLLVLVIVLIYCWCRRSAKKGNGPFVSFTKRSKPVTEHHEIPQIAQNEYQAILGANETTEHIYNELEDNSKNIYNEDETLLKETQSNNQITDEDIFNKPLPPEPIETEDTVSGNDLSDSLKEPVTMKRSYSSPKDLVQIGDTDNTTCFKDPSYTYPYDKIQRSDVCEENSDVPSDGALNVLADNQDVNPDSRHTDV